MSITDQFRDGMATAGLIPPDTIHGDGKLHRFSSDGKSSHKNGWYFLHLDGPQWGQAGSWDVNGGEPVCHWCAKSDKQITQVERDTQRAQQRAMKVQHDAERTTDHDVAASLAQTLWESARPVNAGHGYLTAKGINANGARLIQAVEAHRQCNRLSPELIGPLLVIPIRNAAGHLRSLQFITEAGLKRPLTGGEKQGGYFAIGSPKGQIIICEGYATGASLAECTGDAVAIAFDAGNLYDVALALHVKLPALKIIVAADDDHLTAGNPGLTKARAAAQAVGGLMVVPSFPADRPDKATDFNDLHQLAGVDAVKSGISYAINSEAACASDTAVIGSFCTALVPRSSVVLTCGADLTPEPVQWLWQEWLALGKFHLLAGAPGQGKTTIAMGFAATVTTGGLWPDGSRCPSGNVLIWSGEDDHTDTLLPRLIAAGADRSRVYFVDGMRVGGAVRPFDPSTDTRTLQDAIKQIGSVRLIVIDPVSTAVAGDSHKNTEVRRGLQPLVDLATIINAALLGITHLSKGGQGGDPAQRVIGSIAFTAVARVVLVAARVKSNDGTDKRILARGKSNIGPDNGGFEYHLAQVEALPGIDASRIEWGQAVQGSAQELLSDPAEHDSCTDHADAVDLLKTELAADCWTGMTLATQPLKEAGFTKKQIWNASKKLNVVRKKGGMGGGWYWRLPGGGDMALPGEDSNSPEGSEDSPSEKQEPMESSTLEPATHELVEVEL